MEIYYHCLVHMVIWLKLILWMQSILFMISCSTVDSFMGKGGFIKDLL